MKIAKITSFYSEYLRSYYASHSKSVFQTYKKQQEDLFLDSFGWFDSWKIALEPFGYEVWELVHNAEPLQRQWAKENGLKSYNELSLESILIKQLKYFKPEIVWFEDMGTEIIKVIKKEIPNIRMVIGWAGSAFPKTDKWKFCDLVLSCAPETVEFFKNSGLVCHHIQHAFDERINQRLKKKTPSSDTIFIGQLENMKDFHIRRIELLLEICRKIPLSIYSTSQKINIKTILKLFLSEIPFLNKFVFYLMGNPGIPYKLYNKLRPGVYGLKMYQTIKNASIILNIHADSSPFFASNMRLFETTGVGGCLITDWKNNINEIFEPDYEIITYKTVGELIEKIKLLSENTDLMDSIALAGQKRTLKQHTFNNRASLFDTIIEKTINTK